MGSLIYLIYPVMAVLLFWGAKRAEKGSWNEEAFSLKQMKALQGYLAICIMLHHIGQKTCANWLEPWMIEPGLELFVPFGYYFVGIFLFCSGYGLWKSYKTKPDYLKGFGKRRILPLVIAFYVTALIFLLARIFMKEPLNGWKVFCYVSGLKLSDPNAWFMIALPLLYFFFYLSVRVCHSDKKSIALLGALVFAYVLLGTCIDHNDYWMRGEWWYNSVHFFFLGVLFGKNEEKVTNHFKRHYVAYFIFLTIAIFVFYFLSGIAQGVFSYYGENWNAPDKIPRRWLCLISQVLASCAFVFWVFLLFLKLKIGNRFLYFMGTITMEFYLIHGLFLEPFAYDFAGVAPSLYHLRNVPLLVLIVFLPSIPAALLLQKVNRLITVLLTGKGKNEKSTMST